MDDAEELSELWWDEGCSWNLTFTQSPYPPKDKNPWLLSLEWATENEAPHDADYCTYVWLFYGASADECVRDALAWAKDLLPFKRCRECDGRGGYWPAGAEARVECSDCHGSGLENGAPDGPA